jgi:lon-related putative ATP-dependent protease
MVTELTPEHLRRSCDPSSFAFTTTAEVPASEGIVGQPRATVALQFGLEMPDNGYHVFVAGPAGTGKMTAVNVYLSQLARSRKPVDDLCYVYNFADPERPRVLRLPPGRGRQLARDLEQVLSVAQRQLPRVFESDEYTSQREAIVKALDEERETQLSELDQHARTEGFALQATPMGLLVIPLRDGRPIREEEFATLSASEREDWQRKRRHLDDEIAQVMKGLRARERSARESLERLDHDVALYTVGGLLEDLMERYADLPTVIEYLQALREDLANQVNLFRAPTESGQLPVEPAWARERALRRYHVNVIVDNSQAAGAPVVLEAHPIYQNLIGRIEHEAQFGVLTTDFTLIRGGALHRANGGYLVLQAEDVLRQPLAWDGLKRALRDRAVTIEEPMEWLGMASVRTLRPEPISLNLKVVLIGEPTTFYLLHALDPDFRELFRVRADFDLTMPRTPENEQAFVGFICRVCAQEKLRPVDRMATGLIVDQASRQAEDQERLSVQFGAIADLLREANYWAGRAGSDTVSADHVREALEQQVYRSNMLEEHIRDLIARDTLLVGVTGSATGQVNGLAVHTLADYSFGRPSRITAAIGIGRDGIVDVEREARLGGPLHSKGVMILAGFLVDRFAQMQPLALTARLVFEQSYEEVEGDSASSAELYALLSRLADLPIKQGLAVTGSVNQKGEIQAIGGVNEKIEGFFATCKTKGLTGDQGVLIPASNVKHLMLKEEVVAAVRDGRFHIYPVTTVDEGIELLTGVPAGVRGPDGTYPAGTVNGLIVDNLSNMVQRLQKVMTVVPDGVSEQRKVGESH